VRPLPLHPAIIFHLVFQPVFHRPVFFIGSFFTSYIADRPEAAARKTAADSPNTARLQRAWFTLGKNDRSRSDKCRPDADGVTGPALAIAGDFFEFMLAAAPLRTQFCPRKSPMGPYRRWPPAPVRRSITAACGNIPPRFISAELSD